MLWRRYFKKLIWSNFHFIFEPFCKFLEDSEPFDGHGENLLTPVLGTAFIPLLITELLTGILTVILSYKICLELWSFEDWSMFKYVL